MRTPARQPLVSQTELQILQSLARGNQSKEIAGELDRSRATVEFYIRMLYAKLRARSRAHLVARAYETGLIQVPS